MPKKRKKKHYKIYLYALLLEGGFYYIGISRNPESRFKKHLKGKGARWTILHKPVEIIEIRPTKYTRSNLACLLEDKMTLEYAAIHGYDKVRGGGYCQQFPHWPKER